MPTPPKTDVDVFQKWTDTQLIQFASKGAGPKGAAAAAEINRRLKVQISEATEASAKQAEALNRYTVWLVRLTVALLVVALVQVAEAFELLGPATSTHN